MAYLAITSELIASLPAFVDAVFEVRQVRFTIAASFLTGVSLERTAQLYQR